MIMWREGIKMATDNDTYAGLVKCPPIQPIQGKDRIGVINLSGNNVIVRKDQFNEGDMGLYIYVDSVLPQEIVDHYELTRLKNGRVKAMKMSGITSQGLFLPLTYPSIRKDAPEYTNLAAELNILHWKPDVKTYKGQTPNIKARNWPSWLEVMHISRITRPDYINTFTEGDRVIVTEKIHGMNATFAYTRPYTDWYTQKEHEAEFSVMSRKVNFKRDRPSALLSDDIDFQTNTFYSIADKYGLEDKLKAYSEVHDCDVVLRGEIFGKGVQDLQYGLDEADFMLFDVQLERGKYVDWDDVVKIAEQLKLRTVPVLYRGKYEFDKVQYRAEANSFICPTQISEGVVVRCEKETKLESGERKILKLLSSAYMTRDDSKEVAE